ncbi:MAG: hypothetical protein VXZ82_05245 [Planctomycetota bacterium]|nr:hypothetical protein [Planctomycetota bacterium]
MRLIGNHPSVGESRVDLLPVLTHLDGKSEHDFFGLMAPTIGEGIPHTLNVAIDHLFSES